jgi:hypothetical protein
MKITISKTVRPTPLGLTGVGPGAGLVCAQLGPGLCLFVRVGYDFIYTYLIKRVPDQKWGVFASECPQTHTVAYKSPLQFRQLFPCRFSLLDYSI